MHKYSSQMRHLLSNFKININTNLFLKDPFTSELGKKIITSSIDMISEMGFDDFTFRKLAQKIESTEASVYRYFESKNQLLVYITSWYWGVIEYKLLLETANIASPELRLEKSIALIVTKNVDWGSIENIEINKLHKIVMLESSKSYLRKDVDKSNQEGAYLNYKQFVGRVVEIIQEINPDYKYPNMLVTTIVEGSHLQMFFAEHLPRLTNVQKSKDYLIKFYTELALKAIKK